MKVVNPMDPVNLLPLLGKNQNVLVQPPLYIGNQISYNPAWLKWCEQVYAVSPQEAVYMAADKSMCMFDGDVQDFQLIEILDNAIMNFSPTRTGNEHRTINNKR